MRGKDYRLTDVMQAIVVEQVNFLFDIKQIDCCHCENCKFDIYAIVLNGLPSKYVVTKQGEFYANFENLKNQSTSDITRLATLAAVRVKEFPRHELTD